MKIIYFHGFASSGASGTVQTLRKKLTDDEIIAPDIPVDPAEALPFLRNLCETEKPDLVIGTSMGGMYAQLMHGYRKICINPAFNMSHMSKSFKPGEFTFFNGRKDNQKTFRVTKEMVQHQFQIERNQFKDITPFDKENTYGLFGVHDDMVNTYEVFCKNYPGRATKFEGGHRLNDDVIRKYLIPLINKIRMSLRDSV